MVFIRYIEGCETLVPGARGSVAYAAARSYIGWARCKLAVVVVFFVDQNIGEIIIALVVAIIVHLSHAAR